MEKIKYKGYIIKLEQDESSESPDDWGNTDIFLVYDHRQFYIKGNGYNPENIFNYLSIKNQIKECKNFENEELEENLKEYTDYESKYWIFPVYAYIHSGVTLSLGRDTYPFTCKFDTSMKGFILAKKDIFSDEDAAYKSAESLIETWNTYLSGNVWCYTIVKETVCKHCLKVSEEVIDSLSGIWEKEAAIKEAQNTIDCVLEELSIKRNK